MSQKTLRRYFDRFTHLAIYASVICFAIAFMRWGHVQALATKHPSEGWTTAWFIGGAAFGLFFLAGWLILVYAWKERAPRLRHGTGEPRESDVPDLDVVSTSLLAALTLNYLTRVSEEVLVADGYYRHTVCSEWLLPVERDADMPDAADNGSTRDTVVFVAETESREFVGEPGEETQHTVTIEQEAALLTRRTEHATGNGTPAPSATLEQPQTYLVPVLRVARGRVVDDLVIEGSDGTQLSACNTEEFAGIVRQILNYWVEALTDPADAATLSAAVDQLITKWRFDTTYEKRTNATASNANMLVLELKGLTRPARWTNADAWRRLRQVLINFCEAVAEDYILFVPVKAGVGDRVMIRHSFAREHRVVPTRRDRYRYWFGLRPHKHELSVDDHVFAQSYHLTFRAPVEQYVAKCSVTPVEQDDQRAKSVVLAPLEAEGPPDYAHIYIRPAEKMGTTRRSLLRVAIECHEKPPGLIGIVALVSLAQAILIWIIGKFYGTYFPASGSSLSASTDVPALLLALPGVAAAWLGAQFTGERLRSTSIATINGVFVSGGLAIASTAAAVSRTGGSVIGSWPSIGVQHPIWVALMIFSAGFAADLLVRTGVRCRRFARRVQNQEEAASQPILV